MCERERRFGTKFKMHLSKNVTKMEEEDSIVFRRYTENEMESGIHITKNKVSPRQTRKRGRAMMRTNGETLHDEWRSNHAILIETDRRKGLTLSIEVPSEM